MSKLDSHDRCPVCNEFGWLSTHKCPETWWIFWLDGDGFLRAPLQAKGRDPEAVAVRWVSQLDADTSGEYGFSTGETSPMVLILSDAEYNAVLDSNDLDAHEVDWTKVATGIRYLVEGEYVPHYYATRSR